MRPGASTPANAKVEARNNLFSTVLNAMTDGVMVVDDKLRVVITNRSLRELLLLNPKRQASPLVDVVSDTRLLEAFESVLGGAAPINLEVEHRGLRDRVLDVLVAPLPDHEVWGHRALGVFRDVTERRQLERLLMDFIANASHELRTPTAAILGYAETLVDSPPNDPETMARFHSTIHRHAIRMSNLLEQLLELGRLDADSFRLDLQPIDVRDLVDEVVRQQSEAATEAGISVHVRAPRALARALADRSALETVIGNLIQNAIKYSPPGAGGIEVNIRPQGEIRLRIEVIDRGIGISDDDQKRVFERFYRVDKGRSRRLGGVGLGLSIVKRLVDHLGGEIELSSRIGRGSTFAVLLPTA